MEKAKNGNCKEAGKNIVNNAFKCTNTNSKLFC